MKFGALWTFLLHVYFLQEVIFTRTGTFNSRCLDPEIYLHISYSEDAKPLQARGVYSVLKNVAGVEMI